LLEQSLSDRYTVYVSGKKFELEKDSFSHVSVRHMILKSNNNNNNNNNVNLECDIGFIVILKFQSCTNE
jgi:hypothetical protein